MEIGEQVTFGTANGEPDGVLNRKDDYSQKLRERDKELFIAFIGYCKARDTIIHHKLDAVMAEIGFSGHFILKLLPSQEMITNKRNVRFIMQLEIGRTNYRNNISILLSNS